MSRILSKTLTKITTLALIASSLTLSVAQAHDRYDEGRRCRVDNGGTVAGALAGAVVGASVSHRGSRGAGAIIGAVIGGALGNAAENSNKRDCDRRAEDYYEDRRAYGYSDRGLDNRGGDRDHRDHDRESDGYRDHDREARHDGR